MNRNFQIPIFSRVRETLTAAKFIRDYSDRLLNNGYYRGKEARVTCCFDSYLDNHYRNRWKKHHALSCSSTRLLSLSDIIISFYMCVWICVSLYVCSDLCESDLERIRPFNHTTYEIF